MIRLIPIVILSLLAACGSKQTAATPAAAPVTQANPAPKQEPAKQEPAKQDAFPAPLGLESAELIVDPKDPITADKVALGKVLFFDPRLSANGQMACVTCHPQDKAWTDGTQFSAKFDGSKNTRNTPTVLNVGYYDKLYWDGRAPSLEKNIVAAWKNQMGGKPEDVAKALDAIPAYKEMFQKAFGAAASEDTIGRALGAFLRTLRSGNSAFDRWVTKKDPNALTAAQQDGFRLFAGKAGCIVCHMPSLFSDRNFHNTGIGMDAAKPDPGAGGEKARNDPKFLGAFKTPSLRNVAKTAPYFHDGSVATLRDAVKFMAGGGKDNPNKDPLMIDRKLSDQEIDQIVAFLESLNGEDTFTPPSVPK